MMKKKLLSLATILFLMIGLNAQTHFENPGFEQWEAIEYGPIPEPVNWSSLRTALPDELAKISPPVWGRSTDAHSGSYALYLQNISTYGIVATGTMTNGRIFANMTPANAYIFSDPDDSRWNTPLTHRPDSVTGWFKCNPVSGDFATIKVILYTDSISVPGDTTNWVALAYHEFPGTPVTSWTRFSVPFNYYKEINPGYVLVALTSGNGLSALPDSEAWFDDLKLIYNGGTDINEITANDFKVYVSHKTLNVFINDNHKSSARLQVFDLTGRSVCISDILTGRQNQIKLNVPEGVYIVVAGVGQKVLTRKVMIR